MPPEIKVKKRHHWTNPSGQAPVKKDPMEEIKKFPKDFALAADDIVMCYFPYNGEKTTKVHPAIVLHVGKKMDGSRWAVVAGGTSLKNDLGMIRGRLKPTDFVIDEYHLMGTGLKNPTRFQFEGLNPSVHGGGKMTGGTIITLPVTEEFFMVPKNKVTPVIGKLHEGLFQGYDKFITKENIIQKVDAETARYHKDGMALLRSSGIDITRFEPATISEERQGLASVANSRPGTSPKKP